jgi:hypothetical protein
VARVYFPDEGSAALVRRDWNPTAANPEQDSLVPPSPALLRRAAASAAGTSTELIDELLALYGCMYRKSTGQVGADVLVETIDPQVQLWNLVQ